MNATFRFNRESALHEAVINQKQKVVEVLCAYGANPFITDGLGLRPLAYAKGEIKTFMISYERMYQARKCGNAVILPIAPAMLCYALSADPIYPAVLSALTFSASHILLTGLHARDAKAISGYSAATALWLLAESVSQEYVLPCKLIAGSLAIATACYAESQYIAKTV
ncbi:MAG: hypothetical protein ACK5AV_04505 [Alphaproteobacteria bacterium]